jgi:hypothetical protein
MNIEIYDITGKVHYEGVNYLLHEKIGARMLTNYGNCIRKIIKIQIKNDTKYIMLDKGKCQYG